MSADAPSRRLNVLAAGLHQLGARCESLGGALAATAAPAVPVASRWQASADVLGSACAGSRNDLAALTRRMHDSGTDYAEAGSGYTETDEDGGLQLRGLAL